MGVDWSFRGEYIVERHGVLPEQADEAVRDQWSLRLIPDPSSKSGRTVRVIGWSDAVGHLITVILLPEGDQFIEVNTWLSNSTDQRRYNTGEAE